MGGFGGSGSGGGVGVGFGAGGVGIGWGGLIAKASLFLDSRKLARSKPH